MNSPRIFADRRLLHLALADADTRAVESVDVAEWLASQHADVRASEQFRAAERDAAYDARDGGSE